MNLKDNPGDAIKKTGPNIDEANVLRQMWNEGAKREEYARVFPDILPSAIDLWLASLDKEKTDRDAKAKAAADAKEKAETDAAEAAKLELEAREKKAKEAQGKPAPKKDPLG